ncbi:MAG: hypothetical protein ABI042_02000 [Verrucomicrobiota bacterium]
MSKKNIALFALLLVLGVIYIFYFTNLFRKTTMEIVYQISPKMGRGKGAIENAVIFSINGKFKLTSVKVVEDSDLKTNKYPHALWHLVSSSNSLPTKAVIYGIPVRGMQSEIPKMKPEKLQKNIPYVLLLEADEIKGQTKFQIR